MGVNDLRHLAELVEKAEKVFYEKDGEDKTPFLHIPELFLIDEKFWGPKVAIKANLEDGWISVELGSKE